MLNPTKLFSILNYYQVRYIVVGGFAATLHGCPEQTYDIDLYLDNTDSNRTNLLTALSKLEAFWDRPLDDKILLSQPVFALNSAVGDIDIFFQLPGIDSFEIAWNESIEFTIADIPVQILTLKQLITTKSAINSLNPRKQSVLEYLRQLLALKEKSK